VRLLAACCLLVALVAAPAAAAEPASEADLIRRGVAAREQHRDQEALELFREAFERYRTPRAEAQVGLACQALGRWGEADQHLRAALAAESDPWIVNNRKALEQALTVIGQHVGILDIISNVAGTEVLVDGRLVGELPLRNPLRLSAGTAVVQVRAQGYAHVQRPVTIIAGQLTRETFQLVPLARSVAAPAGAPPAFVEAPVVAEPERAPSLLERRATFIAAAAATVVVGGLAIWSGLDTLSKRDAYEANPTQELYDDGVNRELRTNLLIAGTAVLGAGTAALGLWKTRW
jgi:tetratricopeptide (TPR) repeat protein